MFIKDSVDQAIILLGIKNKGNIFYFPNTLYSKNIDRKEDQDSIYNYYGILLDIDPRLTIEEQITNKLSSLSFFEKQYLKYLNIYENFRVKLKINSSPVGLYLCTIEDPNFSIDIESSWEKLADILKLIPNNKNRIPYMFALQYLATLKEQQIDAVEIDQKELDKYINNPL